MLFNSLEFLVFLIVFFVLYWFVFNKNFRIQNFFIVAGSYVFYGWWDWHFLLLITFTSVYSWWAGLQISMTEDEKKRKLFNLSNYIINLTILGVFKYYNFFIESFIDAFKSIDIPLNVYSLNIILPVGISFYTFHALSYTTDIYRRKLEASKELIPYIGYICFFPQLVAGPIERATNLLPQLYKERKFNKDEAIDGMRQILWGFFKKIVIADSCASYANRIFENYENLPGSTLMLGVFYFTFQIYGDFSGYSDIALGTGRLFGFNLKKNFNFPYFSRNIAEFWRRWHISLTSWFRDYLYIPLGGSKGNKWSSVRNTMIVFTVSGFWHGADWTFITWGAFNGLLFLPLLITGKNKKHETEIVAQDKLLPSMKELFQMIFTFHLVIIGWIFFRTENIYQAIGYFEGIVDSSLFTMPVHLNMITLFFVFIMLAVEWLQRQKEHGLQVSTIKSPVVRWSIYLLLTIICLIHYKQNQEFIYFQF